MSLFPTRPSTDGHGAVRRLEARPGRLRWHRVLLVALTSASIACSGDEPTVPATLRPVRTAVVAPANATQPITLAGVARASVESRLSFRVSGSATQVVARLGDRVRKGQVLARLDPADFELRTGEAEAGLAQAQAALRQAQSDYDRARLLYENRNASKSELDAGRAAAESARAQVDAARRQLDQARKQETYTVLRAPLDGSIAQVEIEVDESVQAGQMAFLLTAGERLEVEVAVPEVSIAFVREGDRVQVAFDALPDRTYSATVTEVGVAALAGAAFAVTAQLDAAIADLRPGMAADITFALVQGTGDALAVPLVAVGEDESGRFVFVLEGGGDGVGIVRRRAVEVGELVPGGLEIRSGLEAGEVVVTAGVRRLTDGENVRMSAEGRG